MISVLAISVLAVERGEGLRALPGLAVEMLLHIPRVG